MSDNPPAPGSFAQVHLRRVRLVNSAGPGFVRPSPPRRVRPRRRVRFAKCNYCGNKALCPFSGSFRRIASPRRRLMLPQPPRRLAGYVQWNVTSLSVGRYVISRVRSAELTIAGEPQGPPALSSVAARGTILLPDALRPISPVPWNTATALLPLPSDPCPLPYDLRPLPIRRRFAQRPPKPAIKIRAFQKFFRPPPSSCISVGRGVAYRHGKKEGRQTGKGFCRSPRCSRRPCRCSCCCPRR